MGPACRDRQRSTVKYQPESKLRDLAGCQRRAMQQSDETELHALFDEIDIEHDGLIKSGELQRALEKLGLPHNSKEYLAVLQKQLDRNRDGVIDFKDFREYVLSKEKVAAKTFASLDADGSGSISVTELVGSILTLLSARSLCTPCQPWKLCCRLRH